MKTFEFYVEEVCTYNVSVDAETEEEAREKFKKGHTSYPYCEDFKGKTVKKVEEVK